jgi:type I site-specific restriction endonuclease
LLEAADWRFFDDENGRANIVLELHSKIQQSELDGLGANFEGTKNGFIDFLLLNEKGFPFIVLEAKGEDKEPLAAKEQARRYARAQNCRFVILSNGNLHYFWDLERGNHPKSQVEQITIALIYKFMDDMDAEAEELGGKRKFFTDDFTALRLGQTNALRTGRS